MPEEARDILESRGRPATGSKWRGRRPLCPSGPGRAGNRGQAPKNHSSLILLLNKNFSYFVRKAKAPVSLGVSLPPCFPGQAGAQVTGPTGCETAERRRGRPPGGCASKVNSRRLFSPRSYKICIIIGFAEYPGMISISSQSFCEILPGNSHQQKCRTNHRRGTIYAKIKGHITGKILPEEE